MDGAQDPFVKKLLTLHGDKFKLINVNTIAFRCGRKVEEREVQLRIVDEHAPFEPFNWAREYPDAPLPSEAPCDVPFTAFTFSPPLNTSYWAYTFDITIEGEVCEAAFRGEKRWPVEGAAVLRRRIEWENLFGRLSKDPYARFFRDRLGQARMILPERYDILIANETGVLPTCYRWCAHTSRQFVSDKELEGKVAWFMCEDPAQDFVINLEFEDLESLRRR